MLKLRQACRQVFGIPDYDRYLAHFTRQHPGETPLSRSEFFARSIDRKYGKSGPRCC
ncbi:MAG TPA: YbdD/YjiX family protein [Casimicrobiaceae bacterium]|nr:YbdD/YjiX family protein [Casimicrobiaceae bacterium]